MKRKKAKTAAPPPWEQDRVWFEQRPEAIGCVRAPYPNEFALLPMEMGLTMADHTRQAVAMLKLNGAHKARLIVAPLRCKDGSLTAFVGIAMTPSPERRYLFTSWGLEVFWENDTEKFLLWLQDVLDKGVAPTEPNPYTPEDEDDDESAEDDDGESDDEDGEESEPEDEAGGEDDDAADDEEANGEERCGDPPCDAALAKPHPEPLRASLPLARSGAEADRVSGVRRRHRACRLGQRAGLHRRAAWQPADRGDDERPLSRGGALAARYPRQSQSPRARLRGTA